MPPPKLYRDPYVVPLWRRLVAGRVCLARKRAEYSQAEAAAALGKSQAWISDCESANRRIDVGELAAFAALYRTEIVEFVRTPSAHEEEGMATWRAELERAAKRADRG